MAKHACRHNVPDWMVIAIRELGLTLHDFEVFFRAEKSRPICSGTCMGDDAMMTLHRYIEHVEEMPILLCDED